MSSARERGHERRRARREAREAAQERAQERALAINPNMWGFAACVRAVRWLVSAGRWTRSPTLIVTGLLALASLAWVLGVALGWL